MTKPGTWIQSWADPRSMKIAAGLDLGGQMREALTFCLGEEEAESRLERFGSQLVQHPLAVAVANTFEGAPQGAQLLGQTMFWKGLDNSLGAEEVTVQKDEATLG